MYKVAILGLGQISYKIDEDPFRSLIWTHANTFIKHKKTKLVAVSDPDKNQIKSFLQFYNGAKTYTDNKKLLKQNNIDILSICTPTHTHFEIVKGVVKNNKPKAIFIEKPMGNNLSEAKNISEICKQNNIILAVNYMRRWDNSFTYVKDVIDTKKFGTIQSITAYGATAMLTSTSHHIDLMIYFGGEIEWLVGDIQTDYIRNVSGAPDPGGVALLKFKNGYFGFLKSTSKNDENYMLEIDIIFDDGRISIKEPLISNDLSEVRTWLFSPRKNTTVKQNTLVEYDGEKSYQPNERMLDAISDIIFCLENGCVPKSSGENSILVHNVIQSILESSTSNSKVIINE